MYTEKDPRSIIYTPLGRRNKSRRNKAISEPGSHTNTTTANTKEQKGNYVNPHMNKLIISNSTSHSVTQLCDSKNSVGPDFVNVAEGKFCRMTDKTLWPLCSGKIKDKCFHIGTKQLTVGGKAARATSYIEIGDWTA